MPATAEQPVPLPVIDYDDYEFTSFLEEEGTDGINMNVGIVISLRPELGQTNEQFCQHIDTLKLAIRRHERDLNGVEVKFSLHWDNQDDSTYGCLLRVQWPPRAIMRKPANVLAKKTTRDRGTSHRGAGRNGRVPAAA